MLADDIFLFYDSIKNMLPTQLRSLAEPSKEPFKCQADITGVPNTSFISRYGQQQRDNKFFK